MKIIAGKEEDYASYAKLNSRDPYSDRIVSYAEAWADLMEAEIAKGLTIESCAKATSRTADMDGLTGFMYGCAAEGLAHFWEHGEAFRRWHNIDTQVGTEGETANESGGVLNPAIITISVP
jgi:hypothetical protein